LTTTSKRYWVNAWEGKAGHYFGLHSRREKMSSDVVPMLVCREPGWEIDFCRVAFGAVELSRRSGPDGRIVQATLRSVKPS